MDRNQAIAELLAEKVMCWTKGENGRWINAQGEAAFDAHYLDSDDYYQPTSSWSPAVCIEDAFDVLRVLRPDLNFALSRRRGGKWTLHSEMGRTGDLDGPDSLSSSPADAVAAGALYFADVSEADIVAKMKLDPWR